MVQRDAVQDAVVQAYHSLLLCSRPNSIEVAVLNVASAVGVAAMMMCTVAKDVAAIVMEICVLGKGGSPKYARISRKGEDARDAAGPRAGKHAAEGVTHAGVVQDKGQCIKINPHLFHSPSLVSFIHHPQ